MMRFFNQNLPPRDCDPLDGPSQSVLRQHAFEGHEADGAIDILETEQAELIARLMHLLLADAQEGRINPRKLGLRLIALAWVLNPAHYPDAPSLRALAKRCGVSPASLAHFTGNVSRETGIRNRAQRHAANWRPTKKDIF